MPFPVFQYKSFPARHRPNFAARSRYVPRRQCSVVALAAILSACATAPSPSATALIPSAALPSLVLQPADVPPAMVQFDHGAITNADRPSGPRADPARFGRLGGQKARYRQPSGEEASGPLVIVSFVDLFPSMDAAAQDLAAYREEFDNDVAASEGNAESLPAPSIGDEAVAIAILQPGGVGGVRFYRIAWRSANATASLTVQGFEGEVELSDAVRLAQRQLERMRNAAGAGGNPSPS